MEVPLIVLDKANLVENSTPHVRFDLTFSVKIETLPFVKVTSVAFVQNIYAQIFHYLGHRSVPQEILVDAITFL
jgi:hypothetical protein